MNSQQQPTSLQRPPQRSLGLVFSALAWMKLQFFLHAGDTEIGGFGISAKEDLLYIDDFVTVRQRVSAVTVEFDDQSVADHFDACVDRGIEPQRCGRIWIHTHPGQSPDPSGTDESTFARVFGTCDWSLMFIIGRTGKTYARIAFSAGPAASMLLPVSVDWEGWPQFVAEEFERMPQLLETWMDEYGRNIFPEAPVMSLLEPLATMARPGAKSDPSESGWWDYEEYFPLSDEMAAYHHAMAQEVGS